jgi:LuxR family maltose regulon positive regulatory protein
VSGNLLATKLHILSLPSNLVNRLHLIRRLKEGNVQSRRLTLISAAADNVKSTLLSEWGSQIGIPVAWLPLEREENAPALFWNYFVTALFTTLYLRRAGNADARSQ